MSLRTAPAKFWPRPNSRGRSAKVAVLHGEEMDAVAFAGGGLAGVFHRSGRTRHEGYRLPFNVAPVHHCRISNSMRPIASTFSRLGKGALVRRHRRPTPAS